MPSVSNNKIVPILRLYRQKFHDADSMIEIMDSKQKGGYD